MSIYMGSSPCGPTNSFESGGALGKQANGLDQ